VFRDESNGFGLSLVASIPPEKRPAAVLISGRNLLLMLVNIAFALVGSVLVAFGQRCAHSAGNGRFRTLLGITLRNSIMLISNYEHLVAVEGMP